MTKLYIFDKDGTICQSATEKDYINDVADQVLIPGVDEKCAELDMNGLKVEEGQTLVLNEDGNPQDGEQFEVVLMLGTLPVGSKNNSDFVILEDHNLKVFQIIAGMMPQE